MEEGDLLCQETREETGVRVRVGPRELRCGYDTYHHLICWRVLSRKPCSRNIRVIILTSSSNPYLVSGASFPQAVRSKGLRLRLWSFAGRKHTAVEFDVFALVLLDSLFDSDQFSVRVRFLELP